MTLHQIEYDCKCEACSGTGLYIGMGERDGASVVCHQCKGSGKQHVEIAYESFEGRETHPTAEWVYQTNPGICIGHSEEFILADFGGMSYAEWQDGKLFKPGMENRQHTCPAWFYQAADYSKKPDWDICNSALGYTFSLCPSFEAKEACWKRWDEEFSTCRGHEDGYNHSCTATDNGRAVCDRCGLLRPFPPDSTKVPVEAFTKGD